MDIQKTSGFENVMKLLYIFLPFILFLFGMYFFYFGVGTHNKVLKTKDDIEFIARNIHDSYLNRKYKDFTTNYVAMSNFLPFDVEIMNTPLGYQIPNRFGGKMFFYEAFSTIAERTLYFALYKEPDKYNEANNGVGAYILLLTNLKKSECVMLSQTNWRQFIPNFIGLESSFVTPHTPYNGLYNLKTYLLIDNLGEKYDTKDEGIISRKPLSTEDAEKACDCDWRNCMVALKFL